jgi:TrmH family RNA methyltransferase
MNTITSSQNHIIKEIRALSNKKYREEKKLYFIEGIRFVEEALKENMEFDKILISEKFADSKGGQEFCSKIMLSGYDTYLLSEKLFKDVSETESPQGILAVLKTSQYDLNGIIKDKNFILILESLQDPGNMGTIIRTADAAGITGIVMSKGCVDIYNPKVLRSTMGSVFRVPFCICEDISDTIKLIRSKGIKVYAAHLKGKVDYFEADLKENIAIIVGNEANGISDTTAESSDMLLRIPMFGRIESLNASVAASLLMYEAVRQRIKA